MEGNVMTLEDLGDEIMVLEGAGLDNFYSFFGPGDLTGKLLLGTFFISSGTAVVSRRYRKPALVVAAVTGITHLIRTY